MHEVCFCGRAGLLEERAPVYLGDGAWGLECPRCGHADDLRWLAEDAKRELLGVATRRHAALRSRERGDLSDVLTFPQAEPSSWEAAS